MRHHLLQLDLCGGEGSVRQTAMHGNTGALGTKGYLSRVFVCNVICQVQIRVVSSRRVHDDQVHRDWGRELGPYPSEKTNRGR